MPDSLTPPKGHLWRWRLLRALQFFQQRPYQSKALGQRRLRCLGQLSYFQRQSLGLQRTDRKPMLEHRCGWRIRMFDLCYDILSVHVAVRNLFNLGHHLIRAEHYRDLRVNAFEEWGRAVVRDLRLDFSNLRKLTC
jgi:hypothetical protein